jgi:hypothetical protein
MLGALEEKASSIDRSSQLNQVNGINHDRNQCAKNGLTIGIKHLRQPLAY